MSIFLKNTKTTKTKKEDKNDVIKINEELTEEQMEALQNNVNEAALQQLNPMIIPDYFNNIRNNYYVANKIIWLTGFIEWPVITEVMRRINFYDDGTKEPITIYLSSPGGECDARMGIN